MAAARLRVFLDVAVGEKTERLVIELWTDRTPKICESFRAVCTAEQQTSSDGLTCSRFDRVSPVLSGEIMAKCEMGGHSMLGSNMEEENVPWRKVDEAGLVFLDSWDKDANSIRFSISLGPHKDSTDKSTVIGRLIDSKSALSHITQVPLDSLTNQPLKPILINSCGELPPTPISPARQAHHKPTTSDSHARGRPKRRHTSSPSPSRTRSSSPSRGHTRPSGSRHRTHHISKSQKSTRPSSPTTSQDRTQSSHSRSSSTSSRRPRDENRSPKQLRFELRDGGKSAGRGRGGRRRSEASPDHNLRGRLRRRSRSRSIAGTREAIEEGDEMVLVDDEEEETRHVRKRSPPPSRGRSPEGKGNSSPLFRRQRSFPNQYGMGRGTERE
ncbi:cyclophilin-like protein [Aulographum hederae CBS 113979]|uniref:peptidylprolyl isomerase n=1 Tax=Aulographum hederae CBS 113979 TaxID=1176131 RepID=A0A6G1GRF0_9PEZI|nr:cyclophilin-like protein [Aulographum hederae CBS 113979]